MVKAKQTSNEKTSVKKVAVTKDLDQHAKDKKASEKKVVTTKVAVSQKKMATQKTSEQLTSATKVTKTPKLEKETIKKDVENISSQEFTPYKEKKGEEYMSDEMREHFITILKKWRSELVKDMNRTVEHMQDDAANFPDPADRATQEEEFSLELRTRDRERKLIKKIDDTLQLIIENNYGWCESCGVEIGVRRLEARPTATLCIDCKTLAEIKEKQTGL